MSLPVAGVMMSSSRIIKSLNSNEDAIPSFSFQTITTGSSPVSHNTPATSFVPLALFDTSGSTATGQQNEPEPEPEGIFLTNDELEYRLKNSFEQGLTEGKNLAERGLFNAFKTLRTSTEQILSLREKILRESEDELLHLIMLVARKVIIREIAQDRTLLANLVHNAVAGLPDHDEIIVRINPDDYALITSGHEDMLPNDVLQRKMSLKPDPTIMIGCCKVETSMGVVDATLDSQLDEIYRYMKEDRSETVGTN